MDEKDKYFSNHSLKRPTIDERVRVSSSTADLFPNHEQFILNRNVLPVSTTVSRKRSRNDDYSIQESVEQVANKRTRCEPELENQPPRATIKRRSLFLCHPKQDPINRQIQNDLLPSFNHYFPPISTYHHHPFTTDYSSTHFSPQNFYTEHLTNQNFCTLDNETPMHQCSKSSMNLHFLTPPSNVTSPLRTTNFVLDSKQQAMSATIMRTGNISPAHSDTSTESTSTCSSDEQQFRLNFSSFHYQPSRSYRERENYEQLLDLAEKLSDPNRSEKVDIEQFLSYHYKTTAAPTDIFLSKQTACVICMSPFKNGQRIRVLPCQHEYHSKCIARWFTMNSSCPICRRDNFLSTC